MLPRYKEIFYGLLLGVGATLIDLVMHAQMEGRSLWTELIHPQPMMVLYRLLFIAFGLSVGWSLWQKNKRERDFRQLAQVLARFQREIVSPAFLIHGKLQVLMMREDFRFPPEAMEIIRFVYEQAQTIETAAKERLPSSVGA